jgi:DNA-binding NarL/FixJ family response regulator
MVRGRNPWPRVFTIGQKIYGTQVSIGTYMLASPKGHEASAAAEAGGGLVSANRQAVERRDEQILRILNQGLTPEQIAARFELSKANVRQRIGWSGNEGRSPDD